MADHFRITRWIEAVEPFEPVETVDLASFRGETEPEPCEKRLKRTHRRSASTDFLYPYHTQAPLKPQEQQPKHWSQKPLETMSIMDKKMLPRTLNHLHRNKKYQSNADKLMLLRTLQPPVFFEKWDTNKLRNQAGFLSVMKLFETIGSCTGYDGIVPDSVQTNFTRQWKKRGRHSPPSPSYFRKARPHEAASTEFGVLNPIMYSASEAEFHNKHEAQWVSGVYLPLLKHIFDEQVDGQTINRVTVEIVSSATMTPDCHDPSVLEALLTSNEQSVTESVNESFAESVAESENPAGKPPSSRSSSKAPSSIVDLVLALNLLEFRDIRNTVSTVSSEISRKTGAPYYLNQTNYGALVDTIIAVSIVAKKSLTTADPRLQIANWTVGWYNKMMFLRKYKFNNHLSSFNMEERRKLEQEEENKRLITVPLITAWGHSWSAYFVLFESTSIMMHGPVRLGSTEELKDAYALAASLRAIQQWILTEFKNAMEDWLMIPRQHIVVRERAEGSVVQTRRSARLGGRRDTRSVVDASSD